jgi:hypothetical protein
VHFSRVVGDKKSPQEKMLMTNQWTLVFLLATILANFNPASVNSFEHRADAINKVAIVQAEHGK